MNEKNRRRITGLIILFLASCGPIQSGQVADQINAMVGLRQEHVLSCMEILEKFKQAIAGPTN
jgi:hypothetical protein